MEMEESVKEQPLSAGNSGRPKLQRYPLRSSSKSKESTPDNVSDSKRGLSTPRVSRSVGGLDFSGKDKSTSSKPPRRLSIPVRASPSPNPKLIGNITQISKSRKVKYGNGQGPQTRSLTPGSDISKTSGRMKFNLLSSSSYWLNQIKLSESAVKHSVSLGFFKLAWEARCEPFAKMQDELKCYVQRHQLAELGEVKELLQSYCNTENIEQPQISESISQVLEEGTRSSDDEVHCSSSTIMDTEKLKPESLETESTQLTPVKTETTKKETEATQLTPVNTETTMKEAESTQPNPVKTETTKKETEATQLTPIKIETTMKETESTQVSQMNNNPGSRLRENLKKNSANSRPTSDSGSSRLVKKSEKKKPTKQQTKKGKIEVKKQQKKSDFQSALQDVQSTDEISLFTEVA
ncbi:unnamed protein product [Sphenostylis stenocarpa]|uniref:Uncharacterized protein n=1 Tax=Sphenostylis stenocarpa TaxID=92480 RepID=A0AA86V9R9_9FABA|nr:unnamed protein product [Sphenostylis stenocarpa]